MRVPIPVLCSGAVALLLIPTMGPSAAVAGGAWVMFVVWAVLATVRRV